MKIRRQKFIFITYKGDHDPRHVHVFKDGREILKWDLEHGKVMEGKISSRLLRLIRDLVDEGLL